MFRRSLWNGMPTAVDGHRSIQVLLATPIPVAGYVAVGEGPERIWVNHGDYERLVSRASLV